MRPSSISRFLVCLFFLPCNSMADETPVIDAFVTNNLITARAKNTFCSPLVANVFLQEMIQENGGKGSGSFRQFSDAELKDLIAEYDRIESDYCKYVGDLISSENQAVRQSFNKSFFGAPTDDESQVFFQRKDVLDWVKKNGEFIYNTLPISTYASITRYISPDRHTTLSQEDAKKLEVMAGGMINAQNLYYITEAIRSENIKPILPSRFDLPRLQDEAKSLTEEAHLLFRMPEAIKYHARVKRALNEATLVLHKEIRAYLSPRTAVTRERLKQLAIRSVRRTEPVAAPVSLNNSVALYESSVLSVKEYVTLLLDSPKTYGGDIDSAINKVIKNTDKENPKSQANLGIALAGIKYFQGAIQVLSQATRLDPSNVSAYESLGLSSYVTEDCTGALSAYEKALELAPNNAKAGVWHEYIGRCYTHLKNYAEAEPHCASSVSLRHTDPLAKICLGKVQFNLKKYESATESFLGAYKLATDPLNKSESRSGVLASLARLNKLASAPDLLGLSLRELTLARDIREAAENAAQSIERGERWQY